MLARRPISYRNSVCLSVSPSVCDNSLPIQARVRWFTPYDSVVSLVFLRQNLVKLGQGISFEQIRQ